MYTNYSTLVKYKTTDGSASAASSSAATTMLPPHPDPPLDPRRKFVVPNQIVGTQSQPSTSKITSKWGKMKITVPSNSGNKEEIMDVSTSEGDYPVAAVEVTKFQKRSSKFIRQVNVISVSTTPIVSGGIFIEDEDDSLYTENTELKQEFEFKNMTLCDIIKLRQQLSHGSKFGGNFSEKSYSSEYADEKEPSPMSVLHNIAKQGILVEVKVKELSSMDDRDARQHRWRAEWACGVHQGVGEGGRKLLAKQAGAMDLLKKLKNTKKPEVYIPECKIPIGCLICPYLFVQLDTLVQDYAVPTYQIQVSLTSFGKKEFTCLCRVNGTTYLGESSSPVYAKRFAAKRAFDSIAEKPWPLDYILMGDECFEQGKYKHIESEVNHIHYMRGPMAQTQKGFQQESLLLGVINIRKRKNLTVTLTNAPKAMRVVKDSGLALPAEGFRLLLPEEIGKGISINNNHSQGYEDFQSLLIARPNTKMLDTCRKTPVSDPQMYCELADTDSEDA